MSEIVVATVYRSQMFAYLQVLQPFIERGDFYSLFFLSSARISAVTLVM
jgi:hypothetical protein